ncbi:hypothetical protein LXL04_007865 [Taraxacum kok-saghyz]
MARIQHHTNNEVSSDSTFDADMSKLLCLSAYVCILLKYVNLMENSKCIIPINENGYWVQMIRKCQNGSGSPFSIRPLPAQLRQSLPPPIAAPPGLTFVRLRERGRDTHHDSTGGRGMSGNLQMPEESAERDFVDDRDIRRPQG